METIQYRKTPVAQKIMHPKNTLGTLIIETQHVKKILAKVGLNRLMDELIEKLEHEIINYHAKNVHVTKREGYRYTEPRVGLVEWMPVYHPGKVVTIKIVGFHPDNPARYHLSSIQALLMQYDCHTGQTLCLCEGFITTALRTGGASAIASKYLAHPESKILGLVGCGAQALTQLHALSRIFNFESVMLYDTDKKAQANFSSNVTFGEFNFLQCDLEMLEKQSDIICTATSSEAGSKPVILGLDTQNHLHVNAVGSDVPGKIEIPKEFLKKSFVVPDYLDQAVVEGECQQLESKDIGPCIETIVSNPNLYVDHRFMRSVYDSTGFSLQDYAILEIIKQYALEMGTYSRIELDGGLEEPKNPYFI